MNQKMSDGGKKRTNTRVTRAKLRMGEEGTDMCKTDRKKLNMMPGYLSMEYSVQSLKVQRASVRCIHCTRLQPPR